MPVAYDSTNDAIYLRQRDGLSLSAPLSRELRTRMLRFAGNGWYAHDLLTNQFTITAKGRSLLR